MQSLSESRKGSKVTNLFLVIVESAIQTFTMTNTITFGLIENSKHFCFGRCICQSNPALWWGHLTTIMTYIVMSREFQKAHDSCTSVLKSSNARMVDRGSVKLMKLLSIKIRLGLWSELFKIRLPWQRKTETHYSIITPSFQPPIPETKFPPFVNKWIWGMSRAIVLTNNGRRNLVPRPRREFCSKALTRRLLVMRPC